MAKAKADRPALSLSIKQMTPQGARELLKRNPGNRQISRSHVAQMAQDMSEGAWQLAQPLMIADDGTLLDGQHRLLAVCESGVPVDFVVIKGYSRDTTFAHIDDTKKRNLASWLEIEGVEHAQIIATMIGIAWRWAQGWMPFKGGGHQILRPLQGVEFLRDNPKLRDAATAPGTVNVFASRALQCWLYYEFAKKDKALADTFFVALTLGEADGDEEDDPVMLLRAQLDANRRRAKGKMSQTEVAALYIKAWNAVRGGRRLQVLRWSPQAERFPTIG